MPALNMGLRQKVADMTRSREPFGGCIYDQAIADSVRQCMSARQIADRYYTDAAAIRARAKSLGIELYVRDPNSWHAQATELYRQGLGYQEISVQVHRDRNTIRTFLVSSGMIEPKRKAQKIQHCADVRVGKDPEKTLLDLPSRMPWPESVLRLPISTPKELRVPCVLVQNGKIVRRFSDMIGAFQAQKSLPGESQVIRKSDGQVLKNKTIKTPKYPTWAK